MSISMEIGMPVVFFFFKQKTAYEIGQCLEFRRVLFRSRSLRQTVALLTGGEEPDDPPVPPLDEIPGMSWTSADRLAHLDLADIAGQEDSRMALVVAAAGGHHLLMTGPPGIGKTMLAQRLPGLLPDLTHEQSLAVSAVHSVAGVLPSDAPLLRRPPFLDPHHTASAVSIVG